MPSVYDPLHDFLAAAAPNDFPLILGFAEIEGILDRDLPRSARDYVEWWGNEDPNATQHSQSRAWTRLGLTAQPDLAAETVTFTH
jgi:hypothetical protein